MPVFVSIAQGGTGANNANSARASLGVAPNVAYDQANSAFNAANNRVLKTGDVMAGQLNISSGGLLVTGNAGFGTATPNAALHVTGTIIDNPIINLSANASYADNAAGRVIVVNSSSNLVITAVASIDQGFSYTVLRRGTGNVTISNSGVTRINSAAYSSMNVTQNAGATVLYTATNEIFVFGDFM